MKTQVIMKYTVSRQLKGVSHIGRLKHTAILFLTSHNKYGICEWMNDSKIHYYYLSNP